MSPNFLILLNVLLGAAACGFYAAWTIKPTAVVRETTRYVCSACRRVIKAGECDCPATRANSR